MKHLFTKSHADRHYFTITITAILLLAAIFRIYHLNQRPIWTDEGTVTFNLFNMPNLIQALATRDHHPPLYYLLLQVWIRFTGDSILSMRMFSALLSMVCVALMVPLARHFRLAGTTRNSWLLPVIAALALALSDPDIDLSQEIRFYALRTLLVILSVLFYFRWQRQPSRHRALLWMVANIALYHTNYQGAFIILFEILHALIFLRGRMRWAALGWLGLATVFFLPWFVVYGFNQQFNPQGLNSKLPSDLSTLIELTFKFLGRQWPLMLGLMLAGMVTIRPPTATASTGISAYWKQLDFRPWNTLFFLIIWIGLTLIITFIGNQWFSILSPRRIMLISPAIALLVGRGLSNFDTSTQLFLAMVMIVYGTATVDDYYPKAPWDKVGADMGRYAESGDMGLMEIYYDDVVLFYYAGRSMPTGTPLESMRMWREYRADDYPKMLLDMLKHHQTIWLAHWSPDQSAFELLKQTGHEQTALLTTDHWGNNLNVYRFDQIDRTQPAAARFQNGMILQHFTIRPDTMRVNLWWTTEQPINTDYTISVIVLDRTGQLVAQHDAFPLENRRPTTSFQPGEMVFDPHPIQPDVLPPGTYTVAVQIYTYWDNAKQMTESGQPWQIIGTIAY